MAKNLKLRIKNTQIAKALKLDGLKEKVSKKKAAERASDAADKETPPKHELEPQEGATKAQSEEEQQPPKRVIRARSKSAFEEDNEEKSPEEQSTAPEKAEASAELEKETVVEPTEASKAEEAVEASQQEEVEAIAETEETPKAEEQEKEAAAPAPEPTPVEEKTPEPEAKAEAKEQPSIEATPEKKVATPEKKAPISEKKEKEAAQKVAPKPQEKVQEKVRQQRPPARQKSFEQAKKPAAAPQAKFPPRPKLGPTGRHVRDLLPPKKPAPQKVEDSKDKGGKGVAKKGKAPASATDSRFPGEPQEASSRKSSSNKPAGKGKEYRDFKSTRMRQQADGFDGRDRRGLGGSEEGAWRKKRGPKKQKAQTEDTTIRPSELSIRLPITIKDLAAEMKLKAAQLISKLFMQGIVVTLNDYLDDETTVQLLGEEFSCAITIDTSEEERIRITDKTIAEEIQEADETSLEPRAPIVAFMGHVDHGKTSLMDAIRESNVVSGEAGAITQHIGAFRCETAQGPIAFLDTPGHEAFSAMRVRGAELTDIVVLVVAGDEGMRDQTVEAIRHAKAAGVSIVVAINKCDKPDFDVDNVYRQLAEQELLPEAWGGQTITVNTSAVSKEGISELLEMLALQAEVLELQANPQQRARGTVIEAEMHKGLGHVATVMVQNGTLRSGDSLVFACEHGRVRTMRDEHGKVIQEAGPAMPVRITGLSGIPEAGEEFIAVAGEQEARAIAEVRREDEQFKRLMVKKALNVENLLEQAAENAKKVLHVILRADMHGSLEALKAALLRIKSDKVSVNVVSDEVGEISESDVDLAAASKSIIIGFHTQVESHAESMIRTLGVSVQLYDVIYHAVDAVKELMLELLDKTEIHEDRGIAEIKQVFRSPSLGKIAGCLVTSGIIKRTYHARVIREEEVVWSGPIQSLKRVKEDVKEVQHGFECGILLNNCNDIKEGDILQTYEVIYQTQQL